jgi:DNA repair exonuclease SbcCD nuclease subunit
MSMTTGLRLHGGDGTGVLRDVLATARALGADAVILAGDTFDNHQVTTDTIDRAGMLLAEAKLPLVILPGNHDPATPDSIWMRGRFDEIGNVAILGITNQRSIAFLHLDLEIWGNAHRDYHDMPPLRDPPPRAMRWHIAMGHGHYEPPETWHNPLRPSWLISDAMIAATGADYVALGHWDRAAQVGCGAVPAYYSGSPDYAHGQSRAADCGRRGLSRAPVLTDMGEGAAHVRHNCCLRARCRNFTTAFWSVMFEPFATDLAERLRGMSPAGFPNWRRHGI